LLERDTFKECIASNYREFDVVEFGLKMTKDESLYIQYPALPTSVEIVLLFPASTSVVGRGFSYQNAL
jgi:hypothetical protein